MYYYKFVMIFSEIIGYKDTIFANKNL
jgi:hypothetical protein